MYLQDRNRIVQLPVSCATVRDNKPDPGVVIRFLNSLIQFFFEGRFRNRFLFWEAGYGSGPTLHGTATLRNRLVKRCKVEERGNCFAEFFNKTGNRSIQTLLRSRTQHTSRAGAFSDIREGRRRPLPLKSLFDNSQNVFLTPLTKNNQIWKPISHSPYFLPNNQSKVFFRIQIQISALIGNWMQQSKEKEIFAIKSANTF